MHRLKNACPAVVEYRQQKTGLIWLLLLWVLVSAPARLLAVEDQPLRITRVTPSGVDVPPGKQIVIQFNQPVVPLGRMARSAEEIPIRITPALACQWRWLNTSALACQLDDKTALQPSQQYHLTVQPGQTGRADQTVLETTDGKTLVEPYEHRFTTKRARVRSAYFQTWKAPGWPVIRLVFNQPVSQESVAQHVFLTLGQNVADEKARQRYPVSVQADPVEQKLPRFFRAPGENYWVDFGDPVNRKSDDDLTGMNGQEARRVWLVAPHTELPLDTAMQLWTEPGIESALGPERSVDASAVVEFHTFPEFVFRGIQCWDKKDERLFIEKEKAAKPALRCNPLRSVALAFSAPVLASEVKQYVRFDPDLAGGRKDYDPWANQHDSSSLGAPHYQDRLYSVYLPERLRAARKYRLRLEPDSLKDEFGRTLSEGLDFHFFTDHRSPDYTLANPTAVLEQHVDTQVPLYVTNLDRVRLRYTKLTQDARQADQELQLNPAQVDDLSFAIPLGVRQALGEQSGVVYGKLETTPRVEKWDQARTVFAQVTPYAVHVKLGHFNGLVWVTDLASGKPVPDARVRLYKDAVASLSSEPEVLSEGQTNADGMVLLPGTERVDPQLQTFRDWSNDQAQRLVVRIDTEAAMALVPLDPSRFRIWTYRVSNWEVSEQERKIYGHMHAWGTTAQGIYRAGDTIQYKIYVRDQDNARFIPPPRDGYSLEIIDPQGKTVHEATDVSLSEFGGYHGSFTVPQNGAVGWYSFTLRANFTDQSWQPLRVLVSDFTPASFRVTNTLNGERFRPEARLEVETRARLHSGGPYTDAITRVTALLKPKPFASEHALAQGFVFGSGRRPNQGTQQIFQQREYVNDQGDLLSAFSIPSSPVLYGSLVVESAVQDDRGKFIAATARADYVGVDRFVGLKNTAWLYQEDELAAVQLLVVDEAGIPVAGTPVTVTIERQVTKAARVKGAGNAYLTQFVEEWQKTATCNTASGPEPLPCTFIPEEPGSYRITATIQDTKGKEHVTQIFAWVAGKGRVLWSRKKDDNSLQIIPEAGGYKIGDTARYLIKNPFPGASALVSVERYGVLKHWVQTLEGSTPVVEFPIEPDFLPGFYLSVLVVSPRVETPLGVGEVDLGKPAFRMGYVQVPVKDPYKEVVVDVTIEKDNYKPRDTINVSLRAKPRRPGKKEPIELAITVLDEAVFDLLTGGKNTFDPYTGFYRLDGLDLKNFNLLMGLVGRQKFEKKGADPGGDGGPDRSLRSLFKFVSYWNPSIIVDETGRADVSFEAPDNLTGWRVLAMAVTPTDRMGLGEGTFTVNRPTEVRPVMPNQVREGDHFAAGFSVMNRTDQPREVTVTIRAEGDVDAEKTPSPYRETVRLAPYKRTTVWMEVHTASGRAKRDISKGTVRSKGTVVFAVTAGDDFDQDGLVHQLPVYKRRSFETAATYGSTTEAQVQTAIEFPKNMHTDVGALSVTAAPTVIGSVAGAFAYMRDYPYTCWEQVLSKGVMAAHYLDLRAYITRDFVWPDSQELPQQTLDQAANYQAPNGGMTYFVPQDRYASPYLSAYTALAFNWLRTSGYHVPQPVEQKLYAYLENYLKRDTAPSFYSKGMSSTVRAVALAALAEHQQITAQDVERYRPHVPFMSLFGKAHYLQALLSLDSPKQQVDEVLGLILSHANESGGKIGFNEELDDGYARILATPLRTNCAILSALTHAATDSDRAPQIGELPFKLVRTITQARGNRDRWENTQENMFCLNALTDYRRQYEQTAPELTIRARVDTGLLGEGQFSDFRDEPLLFERAVSIDDPGRKATVTIEREGRGRVYYATRLHYAPLPKDATRINAGLDIRREYSVERDGKWVLLEQPFTIKRGELVRVDLYLSVPTARHFVVVDDAVPGGLEPVNRDLATASVVDADKGAFQAAGSSWWFHYTDWRAFQVSRWSFYHQELRYDSARFYADYLEAGNYHLSYTAQAIASGDFAAQPVHVEEMYDPDVFGKGLPGTLQVEKVEQIDRVEQADG